MFGTVTSVPRVFGRVVTSVFHDQRRRRERLKDEGENPKADTRPAMPGTTTRLRCEVPAVPLVLAPGSLVIGSFVLDLGESRG